MQNTKNNCLIVTALIVLQLDLRDMCFVLFCKAQVHVAKLYCRIELIEEFQSIKMSHVLKAKL